MELTTSAPSKFYSFYPNLMNVLTITSGVTHFALPPTWTSNPIPCTLLSTAKMSGIAVWEHLYAS